MTSTQLLFLASFETQGSNQQDGVSATVMVRENEPTLNEAQFVRQALKEKLRLDGRSLFDTRTPTFRFGEAFGTVEASLGHTKSFFPFLILDNDGTTHGRFNRVLVKITASVATPKADRGNEGVIQFNVDFSPMASPSFFGARQTDDEILVNRTLDKALKVARAIETESLCILAGEKVTFE